MRSTIRGLAELILKNVDELDASIQRCNRKEPSLNNPFNPEMDYPYDDPEVLRALDMVSAAATQLLQTVRPPWMSLISEVLMYAVPACIRAASEFNIAEILRDAGPTGLHVKEIAKICKTDPVKLSPILRVLASRLIFKEVHPDVFANNRLSSMLDKGLSVEELQKPNTSKYDNPRAAFVATLNHLSDEGLKCAAYLYESVSDPDFAMSGEPNRTAMNKAFLYEKTIWDFFGEPTQKHRFYRHGVAMEGIKRMEPPDLAVKGDGFTWEALLENDLVVDVGGGIGSISMQVAEMYPKLKLVVQDRAPVIANGVKHCEKSNKRLLTSGQISFEEHDFFTPQPIKNPSVFLMKHIIHDWSDEYATKILRQLREAAGPHTKLYVAEIIQPYTCTISPDDKAMSVPGFTPYRVPPPLSIVGGGNSFPYVIGLMMMLFANGQERTIGHYVELFEDAGWKIERVFQPDLLGHRPSQIRAVPI